MLLDKSKSCLVMVDVQEKLVPKVMHAKQMVQQCEWLLRLASEMDVPILAAEQYPKGLGPTIEPLKSLLPPQLILDKLSFSALQNKGFEEALIGLYRKQVVLIGIETHVCILQTALDLKASGYHVFVVVDAVSARDHLDHQTALSRMQHQGIHLLSSEMVFFEWLKQAGTPVFKALSHAFLK